MKRRHVTAFVAAVLGLAFGALAATVHDFSSAKLLRARTVSSGVVKSPANNLRAEPPPVDPVLVSALQSEGGAERWLRLLSAAEKATATEMPGLIRAAGNDSAMIRMLGARWAELDPSHMFHTLYAEFLLAEETPGALPQRWTLADVLFEQWIKTDVPGAIKVLNDVPNFSGRESLRMTVANQVIKTDVEHGLQVMKEWNIRNYIPDMKSVVEWAGRDPRHAAEVVVKFGSDYVAREALKQVGKAWAQRDPSAGLEFAATLNGAARGTLGGEIIRLWAEKDVAAAADFAAAQSDPAFRASLAQGLVTAWGKTDPAAALAWSQENLRGGARSEVIGGLIKSAAERDIASAAELVAGMDAGAAQNRACASIFETWFNKGKEQRTAAFEWLAALPDPEARRTALERVQWNWMWNDPTSVRDFIAGPFGHLASSSMIDQVARNQAAKNPEAAMQWASTLPAERSADARNAVLQNWVNVRPEGASAYVRKLPAGAERDRAIRTVSQTLVFQSPEQAAEWFRQLPRSDQKIAREVFDHTSLNKEQQSILDKALKE